MEILFKDQKFYFRYFCPRLDTLLLPFQQSLGDDGKKSTVTEIKTEGLLEGVFDLADKDNDYLFYRDQIMNKGTQHISFFIREGGLPHVNFLCSDSMQGPVAVSMWQDENRQRYVSLIRTAKVR